MYALLSHRFRSAVVFGLGFLALVVPAAQAQQEPLNFFKNYFVTGDYVVGGVGLAGKAVNGSVTSTINFSGVPCTSGPGLAASVVPCTAKGAVPADVIAAFLYWQTVESTETPSSANGSFNATAATSTTPANPNTFSGLALGNPAVLACAATGGGTQSGEYAHVYRADVLKYLPINNTANVRVANGPQTFTLTSTSSTTQFNGATLVVVYRLVTPGNPRIAPLRAVVIYDGAFTGTPSAGLIQTYMGGIYQTASNAAAHMTQVVGNGQSNFSETLTVNGGVPQGVSAHPFVGALGGNWDNYTYNINLLPGASSVWTEVVSKDCLSWGAIITSANVQDSDSDGLLDIWETSGLVLNPGVRNDGVLNPTTPTTAATFGTCPSPTSTNCLNLPAMGASPTVPDIFLQIDWMQYTGSAVVAAGGIAGVPDHIHTPQYAALSMVGAAFKSHGINVHFDVGNNYQGQAYIIKTPYAQGGNVVEESNLLCPNTATQKANLTCAFPTQSNQFSELGWKLGFDAIKNGDPAYQANGQIGLPQLFATDRKDTFHYALFAHGIAATTPFTNPLAGSISGVADHPGGDLMVSLGLWRSDITAIDQVGNTLEQAGTLMHELGHNLGLSHGGWYDTPVCMPDYPSVMNYLYQVEGLTDSQGVEHIDYSYGLELPMSEDFLSAYIPMGIQNYAVRYFGPINNIPKSPLANTPGQASKVYCNGNLLTGSEGSYVRLQGSSVSTPDWSNGTISPLGTLITKGLDINYDGSIGQVFTDSPDWISLNLQQVGARPNANGLSLNVGQSDIGQSDIGQSDIGQSDIGQSDIGTAALGQDALGDQDYASVILSGVTPPSALTAGVTTNQPSPANPNTGGTGNHLTWTPTSAGQASSYNIYRCNASAVPGCVPAAPAFASVPGGTATPSFTDFVNNYTAAGATCPSTPTPATCYNTNYTYFVTEAVGVVNGSGTTISSESGPSNSATSEVNHLFVIANNQTIAYGSADPTPTYTLYGNGATSLTGVTCVYTPAAPKNGGTYPITCSPGPTTVGTAGVSYNASYLTYTPGILTITPRSLTVTAQPSTKPYNGSNNSTVVPKLTAGTLITGDTITWYETYNTKNVGTGLTLTPAGTATGTTSLSSYNITYVPYTGTGAVITAVPLTIAAATNTKPYDGTMSAAAIPTTPGLQSGDSVTFPSPAETYNTSNIGTGLTLTVSPGYVINDTNSGHNYSPVTVATNTTGVITAASTTTTISMVSPSPATAGQPVTVTVTVAPQVAGTPTGSVTVNSSPAGTSCTVLSFSSTGSCMLTFNAAGPQSLTATYTSNTSNFAGSATSAATPLTVNPSLTSITVVPAPHTSFTGDTVWVNYDWPGQGTILYNGGSAPVTPSGTMFGPLDNTYNVNAIVTGTSITVNFPNGWTFNNTPMAFDGLAITDPLATITGVSLASTNISGFTGSASQLYFDGNDVYINFPHPAFPSLPAGSTLSVNVTFSSSSPAAPYTLPAGSAEQFTAIGNYSSGPSQNLTGLVTWATTPVSGTTAAITSGGSVSGSSAGTSTITATLGGVTGTATVTIPSLVSIAVTPKSPSITGTNTEQFAATGTYSDSSTLSLTNLVTWASSATGVATINATGLATGVSPGSTRISAALGGVTGTMLLTVNSALPANLTITPSSVPTGQFMSPYTPVTMMASGGSGSYTWALLSALPLGMTLNPTTGVISGTPSQAGQWDTTLTATDTVYQSLTGTIGITVNIGLATAYAGQGNCYMPYPATPMFYPGDSTYNNWSVTASGALAGQFSILPASATGGSTSSGANDVLVGCPVGVPSGTYQLTFNISSGDSLTLPLQVVGQDNQDNSTPSGANNGYYINLEGVGGGLPPQSVQQGVLSTNQTNFPVYPSYGADSESFAGNFLFGFNGIGVDPNGCGTGAAFSDGIYLSAAPPNPGRYDLLFDGTTSSCPAAFPAPFPTSPAPIVFASVDVLNSSVPWNGSIISSVQLDTTANAPAKQSQQNVLNALDIQQQAPGTPGGTPPATIPVTVSFTAGGLSTNAILFGLSTDYLPQACIASTAASLSTNVNVPNVPGRYYIAIDTLSGNACSLGNWPNGTPGVSQFIGIVDVWAAPSGLPGNSANFTPSASGNITITPPGTTMETVSEATNTINFAFCVGPNFDNCMSSGMYGSVTISANQVSFQFYGSTEPDAGSFVIYISGLTSTINSVTPNTGSLGTGTFGLTSFTSSSMTFTGTTSSGGFDAVGGIGFTFNIN